jgi:DNA recombination protein RmuC
MLEIVYFVAGLAIGAVIIYLAMRSKTTGIEKTLSERLSAAELQKQEAIGQLDKEKSILEEKYKDLQQVSGQLGEDLEQEVGKNRDLNNRITRAEAAYESLREKLDTQKREMEELQKRFTLEFENVASKILKQNTLDFTQLNQKHIGEILNPLKEKILTFERKVEDTYQKGLKDQTDLRAELKKLYDLNARISQEANNLTRALKSDSKKQGNWGEIVLERVLERSGLVKGQEYDTQVRATTDDGRTIQPDVIVRLPEDKHIIIDSKVSLVAYESFVSEENDEKKELHLKQHVESIKNHVKGLSEKNYQNAALFDTPDFVLLFLPIESAFSTAIQADISLFNFAWEKKIVIVSPTTLLATLTTIASIWKHEKQTQNAIEIARQGGALYDKFVGFLKNIEELGIQIGRMNKTYEDARNKLFEGRGNLIRQVENLKTLGAKTVKSLPDQYLNQQDNGDDEPAT